MSQKNKITILSTFANDRLINKTVAITNKQKGGPAFFIDQIFKNEKISFDLKTGPKMEVQILITEKGEFGKIPQIPPKKTIRFSQIKTPFLLISSVLKEFDLANLSAFKGKTFLDVQGYVRNGNDFGKKKLWKPNKKIFSSIYCLKGTKEELLNIPKQYIETQKQKILLITNGKLGCEVFAFGKYYKIKPLKVVSSKNTIGAGDTFFAYFVSCFMKTANILNCLKYATNKTSAFLAAQNNHHHNQLFLEETGRG